MATVEQASSFWLLTTNADLDAINRAISDALPINDRATKLQDEWKIWFDSLTWYDKNVGTATFDEARNRRNTFFFANTPVAKQDEAKAVMKRGLSTEQQEGGSDRRLASGSYYIPPEPWIPTKYKVVGIVTVAGVGT